MMFVGGKGVMRWRKGVVPKERCWLQSLKVLNLLLPYNPQMNVCGIMLRVADREILKTIMLKRCWQPADNVCCGRSLKLFASQTACGGWVGGLIAMQLDDI